MKIVLDTNILISAFIFPNSKMRSLWDTVKQNKEIELYLSEFILKEFRRISIEKFEQDENLVLSNADKIRKISHVIELDEVPNIIDVEDDNHIVATAVEVKVDYLITGDKKDILPLGEINEINILPPSEFFDLIDTDYSRVYN